MSFYIPHERERSSGSQEKQTFQILFALLILAISLGHLSLKRLLLYTDSVGNLG